MEGKFFFRKKDDPIEKHEHVEFILDNEISFRYHDVRKFGKMYLICKTNSVVSSRGTYNRYPLSFSYLSDIQFSTLPLGQSFLFRVTIRMQKRRV